LVIYDLVKTGHVVIRTYLIGFFCYICGSIYYNFIISGSSAVISDFQYAIKPLFIIVFIYWVSKQSKFRQIDIDLRRLSLYLTTIIGLNQVVGLFGYGYSSYSSGVGTTGFFYSGNEYGAIMLAVVSLQLLMIKKHRPSYYYPIFLLLLTFAVTTAIKTAILGILVMGLFIAINFNFKKIVAFTVTSILLIQVIYYFSFDYISNIPALNRLIWIFQNKGVETLLFSGRDAMLNEGFDFFINKLNIIEQFLGLGYYRWHTYIAHPEMDMFDIIFMYGFVGLFIIYLPFVFQLFSRINKGILAISIEKRFVGFMALLFFSISFVAGHVIFSVALSPFLAITLNIDKLDKFENTINF